MSTTGHRTRGRLLAVKANARKQEGSNNYETQPTKSATVKRHILRKVLDYQHKITTWLVREYDAVFVEDLAVKGMLE